MSVFAVAGAETFIMIGAVASAQVASPPAAPHRYVDYLVGKAPMAPVAAPATFQLVDASFNISVRPIGALKALLAGSTEVQYDEYLTPPFRYSWVGTCPQLAAGQRILLVAEGTESTVTRIGARIGTGQMLVPPAPTGPMSKQK